LYFVKRVLHCEEMPALCAIIQDLVSGIRGSTVDAYEMIHSWSIGLLITYRGALPYFGDLSMDAFTFVEFLKVLPDIILSEREESDRVYPCGHFQEENPFVIFPLLPDQDRKTGVVLHHLHD
jgi:hypothetical protein